MSRRAPVCFNERDLDDGQLVANAELKGATPLMEFAGDSAMTFTYWREALAGDRVPEGERVVLGTS